MDDAAIGSSKHSTMRGKRLLKFGPIQFYRDVPCAQNAGGFGCINQFVGLECFTIADCISRPRTTLLVHEGQEQTRIEPAAEKNPYRHIAEQVPFYSSAIQIEQFLSCLCLASRRCERVPACNCTIVLRDILHSRRSASCREPVCGCL